MVNPEFILAPAEVKVTFALMPHDNALNSWGCYAKPMNSPV